MAIMHRGARKRGTTLIQLPETALSGSKASADHGAEPSRVTAFARDAPGGEKPRFSLSARTHPPTL